MAKIVAFQSFRRATGRSNIIANLATVLGRLGQRVGVIDADFQSPSMHLLMNLSEDRIQHTLNDYLQHQCRIRDAAYDITPLIDLHMPGLVFLVPSSTNPLEIAQITRDGYDVNVLNEGFHMLTGELELDMLLIDTHAGLNEETMLSIAVADAVLILMRHDHQDYRGTVLTVEWARRLDVPNILLVVNQMPDSVNADEVRAQVEQGYGAPVVAMMPHSDEFMSMASSGMFVMHYPDHVLTKEYERLAYALMTFS